MPANNTYVENENLDFVLTHPFPITVTGTPRLSIDVGGNAVTADYLTGTGTKNLTFRYTVQAGDLDTNGVEVDPSIDLNSGTLTFTDSGQTQNATLDITGIPNSNFVDVDTIGPSLLAVLPSSFDTYYLNEQIDFIATFDGATIVSGTPRIPINIGGTIRYANYISGNGTATLIFRYSVQGTDLDLDGIDVTSPMQLNGGSLKDDAGNDASLSFLDGNIPTVLVDGDSPFVSDYTLPTNGTYVENDSIVLDLIFSEAVDVAGGFPTVDLDVGGNIVNMTYLSGSGTDTLRFRWLVLQGEYDNNGVVIGSSISLNGATIRDASSNDARLSLSTGLTPNVLVDSRVPEVISLTPPNDNDYADGETLDFSLQFNETVVISGTPRLAIQLDSGLVYADYVSGSGSDTVNFQYSVQAIDEDTDGITFSSNSIDLDGGSITGLSSGEAAELDFTSYVPVMTSVTINTDATQLIITSQPNDALAGDNIAPAITVEIRSAANSLVPTATNAVTLSFGTDASAGSATLGGTLTVNAVGGVATFSDINIDKAFTGYTLTASSGVLTSATSDLFDISPNTGTNLAFITEPTNANVDANISPNIEVEILDAYGNRTTDTDNISLAINNDPAGGTTLNGTVTVAAVAGLATFNDINLNQPGAGFTLDATSGVLTTATSSSFNIIAVATQLVITSQPTDAGNEITISPDITVEFRDASNNLVTTETSNVTLAFGTDPSAGAAALAGTLTVAAVGGVATFNDISIDTIATGYTFDFTSGVLPTATSNSFDIVQAPATQLVFTGEPSNALAGDNILPAMTVEFRDANNNLVANEVSNVTLSLGIDPSAGAATLGGTITVAAVGGVATFNAVNIDKMGVGYTLEANAGALTPASSSGFNIDPNTKSQLAFIMDPSDANISENIAPAIEVEIQDAFGNRTADTDSISLAINNDPVGGSTLGGTLTVAATAGVASFSDININQAGTGFTIDATSGGLTLATSSAFNIVAVPTQLAITTEPVNTVVDTNIAPAMVVEIRDAANNLVSSATDNITVSFGTDPSAGAATLGGTLTVAAVGGIATFNDIQIDSINTGYTLQFDATGLTGATSNSFDIEEPPATQLIITQEPTDALAGDNISPAITVELRDASNNLVTSETSNVTVAFGTDPSAGSATLGGTLTVAAVGGVATFNDLTVDIAQTGYTLNFTSGVLTDATSSNFNITPNVKSQLVFKTEPTDVDMNSSLAPSIEVEIQDAYGNITSDTDSITLSFNNDPSGSATLGGTVTQSAVSGVASFNDITVDYAGSGFTLDATSGVLTPATSASFNVNSVPAQLVITTQPSDADQLAVMTPSIVVEIRDANNIIVSSATDNISLAFGTDPSAGAATIGGTTTKAAVNGVATFDDITVDTANTGYTFDFTSGALTNAVTNLFTINVAIPTVTIDALSVINTNNVSNYTVTGSCSEDTRTVTLDVGGVAATPTCSGGSYNSGALDLSGVADSPSVLVTADHDNAAATPAVQATQNVVKDTDVPEVSSNTIAANTYTLSETITISVVFDQIVNVTGLPRIELYFESQASANIYASYNGGSGTNTLTFEYDVAAGDADTNGIDLAASIDLNSGTIQDVNSNDATLTLSTTSFGSVFADSAVPSIVEFIEPVDGTYPDGVGLLFQVNFNELVNITGTPRIAVNIGGVTRYATYQTGTGTTGLEFEYIVQPGDADADGITLVSNSIDLNSGSIKGADTDDAVLDFSLYADAMPGVIVDTATGITAPDQVTGLTAAPTTSNTELALSWAIPNDNGTPITSYAVQYREQGQSTWITLSPAPSTNSATVTGLSSGITYEFRVAANNGLLGPFSTISTAEIFDVLSLDPVAWLDATNVNGNGTSPIDGAKVATWVDLTGAASNATEAVTANQPVMEYNAQNGKPAVRFDDHAVGLEGSFTRANGTDLTFVIVGQFDTGSTDKALFEFRESGGGNARGFFIDRRYASNTNYSPALNFGSFQLWRIENNGASAVITENSTTEVFNGGIDFNTSFTGNGDYVLGDDTTGGNRLNGYIAEFLVFDRALTAQEIATLEQYLQNKWGTP